MISWCGCTLADRKVLDRVQKEAQDFRKEPCPAMSDPNIIR